MGCLAVKACCFPFTNISMLTQRLRDDQYLKHSSSFFH